MHNKIHVSLNLLKLQNSVMLLWTLWHNGPVFWIHGQCHKHHRKGKTRIQTRFQGHCYCWKHNPSENLQVHYPVLLWGVTHSLFHGGCFSFSSWLVAPSISVPLQNLHLCCQGPGGHVNLVSPIPTIYVKIWMNDMYTFMLSICKLTPLNTAQWFPA